MAKQQHSLKYLPLGQNLFKLSLLILVGRKSALRAKAAGHAKGFTDEKTAALGSYFSLDDDTDCKHFGENHLCCLDFSIYYWWMARIVDIKH